MAQRTVRSIETIDLPQFLREQLKIMKGGADEKLVELKEISQLLSTEEVTCDLVELGGVLTALVNDGTLELAIKKNGKDALVFRVV